MREVKWLWASVALAAVARKTPISAIHSDSTNGPPTTMSITPTPTNPRPNPRPRRAAKRVAAARSPVRHQAMARTTRPPSSGKPGIRLNTSSSALMSAT